MRKIEIPKKQTKSAINSFITKLRSNAEYRRCTLWATDLDAWHRLQRDTQHQMLIEMQSPLVTINEEGDVSSRDLTRWYVSAYCNMAHLKH